MIGGILVVTALGWKDLLTFSASKAPLVGCCHTSYTAQDGLHNEGSSSLKRQWYQGGEALA